jgi:class 3 adenylate cyclase
VQVQTRYARSGDASIAYQVVGDGPLDVLFVPGFIFHVELIWEIPQTRAFFERLASFSRLILFDKRGQGLSDHPPRAPTLEETMDDMRVVLDAAGCERAALFGVSEGGAATALFAATHPDRTAALALYGTYARLAYAPDYEFGVPDEVLVRWRNILVEEWGGPVGLELLAPSVADDPVFQRDWARLLRMGTSPRGAEAVAELYRVMDVRDALPAIGVPTLILNRADDIAVRPEHGRYLAEHIPGARYVELPGRDHVFVVGDQDSIVDEVEEFLTGERHEREPDRVLATVLFTDIVGSTERAAELGDSRWREVLAAHDGVVRRQLDRHRGRLIKTMGDGLLATFDGPARAIRCACSLREAVREFGIEIRAGLHTGECEMMNGDVGGMAVHIGARVGSAAGPGEVLVSGTVKDLVVGSELEFADRGTRELKGVPGEWHLYAVER